ncbi:HTH-type transcriptional activator IlvY [Chromohalobacter canadensis]|uniref:HTH-type transcriptional activator IlvY n=1 Tax=Chromohalobacter canadensis TaxID=141389 RepID=UPI0021C1B1C2|nr:HTH-type transcriptional activator IlvY [Chromohalobacter canadensis]MCT8470100.1 HTH-type transcriptional activator IlvY [Chromohalobacter canadensis]MCT8473155.1 HTH-type transcriptional activator IlvY [Chromohalobacter canadensis]MCT8500511.1 HTH-type transcriptional activator IlvY [Chromohalobacter canadensis]
MDTRPYQQFLSLADTLHFGRSSELCHVSPSTLSRTIRQLETQLGVTLFERDNRSVRLTHEGRLFQRYARDALEQWDVFRHSLMAESRELSGEISIYCSVTASYSFLYELLSEFRQRHPRIELKLHTGDPASAVSRVLSGEEDMSITARPETLPAQLAFKPIATSPLLFIAPRTMPEWLAGLTATTDAASWGSIPMILSESGLARERTDAWFRQLGVKPRIYAQVAGNEAIVSMVGLGFGVGVVPQIVVDNSPLAERIQALEVEPALTPYEVGLCVTEKKLRNPLVRALWSQIR